MFEPLGPHGPLSWFSSGPAVALSLIHQSDSLWAWNTWGGKFLWGFLSASSVIYKVLFQLYIASPSEGSSHETTIYIYTYICSLYFYLGWLDTLEFRSPPAPDVSRTRVYKHFRTLLCISGGCQRAAGTTETLRCKYISDTETDSNDLIMIENKRHLMAHYIYYKSWSNFQSKILILGCWDLLSLLLFFVH